MRLYVYKENALSLCNKNRKRMSEKKKLGRPKGKNKAKDAEWLFGERLSADDKAALEMFRLVCRVQNYSPFTHGQSPTSLPKVRNKELLSRLVRTARHSYYEFFNIETLEKALREKGCINADELLGIEEGASE